MHFSPEEDRDFLAGQAAGAPARYKEWIALICLFLILSGQCFVASRIQHQPWSYCLTKPFWLDEFHTILLAQEPDVSQILSKLARGADYNPPALPVTLWFLSKLTGPIDEFRLRCFSCGVGLIGIAAMYFLLRQRFSLPVSCVATLGMWSSNTTLATQLFEGRFYSFWFSACAVFCLLLNIRTKQIWQPLALAAISALICSIHYFGVISLGLIVVSQLLFNQRSLRDAGVAALSMGAGLFALWNWIPLYLGQKATLPVPTWIAPPTLERSKRFMDDFILSYVFTLPVFAYALQGFFSSESSPENQPKPATESGSFRIFAAPCSLLLMPIILIAFSYLVQSVLVERYAIPAILAYAPLIAPILKLLDRRALAAVAAMFVASGIVCFSSAYSTRGDFAAIAELTSQAEPNHPLVVHSRHIGYPLHRYAGVSTDALRISFLFREDPLKHFDEVERAVARRLSELFAAPRTLEPEELSLLDEFYLLVPPGEQQRYAGWNAEPLDLPVIQFEKGAYQGFRMTKSQ